MRKSRAQITRDEYGRVQSVRWKKPIPASVWVALIGAVATLGAALIYNL